MVALTSQMSAAAFTGWQDVSISYNSITIFYDPWEVHRHYASAPGVFVVNWLRQQLDKPITAANTVTGQQHLIPVCYETAYAPDLPEVMSHTGLSHKELIALHCSLEYHVFMVGFSPGFPYLGILPPALEMPRKASPALRVAPGSVAIAARQTGIYPAATSGGWNIIGRTPMKIFDPASPADCLLKAGDKVRFSPIDTATFAYLDQYENR